ncbi:hypothetical protein AB833_07735 [Chromatiales bacterium (ex Bugula neritina AB1)]|nr:hypothetical protein AB833_07735 [Chromatiales bacterium (ex Bugula neritina AB1)]
MYTSRVRASTLVFCRGIYKPSALSLVVCGATVAACIALYFKIATPQFIIENTPRLATYDGDDDIFITSDILRLRHETTPQRTVYLVGDSALREVVMEHQLAIELKNAGQAHRIMDLRSGGQTLLESLAIIDNINSISSGLVVLGVSARTFHLEKTDYDSAATGNRRGFTSSALSDFLIASGKKSFRITGVYAIDNFHFLLPRLIEHWRAPEGRITKRVAHQELHQPPQPLSELTASIQEYIRELSLPFENFEKRSRNGLAVLQAIAENVNRNNGLDLLLIEKPLNPLFIHQYLPDSFVQKYQHLMTKIAVRLNVSYLNPVHHFKPDPADFTDLIHVTGGVTAMKYTSLLAEGITNARNQQTAHP